MYPAVVDTNVLIRLITKDDSTLAEKALALLKPYGQKQVLLDMAVLYETIFVLTSPRHYAMTRPAAVETVRRLLETGIFACDIELSFAVMHLYATTKLDFVDCLVAVHVTRGTAESLLTLDKPLAAKLKALQASSE